MPMSKAREIAFGALMAAMMFAVQVGLSFLPNIELVSILVIVSTVAFGRITLMSIYAFVLVEGLCYGFGIWWMNYCYVWLILYVIARIFRRFAVFAARSQDIRRQTEAYLSQCLAGRSITAAVQPYKLLMQRWPGAIKGLQKL